MAMTRVGRILLIAVAATLLGGCGKAVSLSFLNLTEDTQNVYVTTPHEGRRSIGLVPPLGRLNHTIVVPDSHLPAACTWQIGSVSQGFTVTKKTRDKEVTILPTGGAQMRDRDSSLKDMLEPEINPKPGRATRPPGRPGASVDLLKSLELRPYGPIVTTGQIQEAESSRIVTSGQWRFHVPGPPLPLSGEMNEPFDPEYDPPTEPKPVLPGPPLPLSGEMNEPFDPEYDAPTEPEPVLPGTEEWKPVLPGTASPGRMATILPGTPAPGRMTPVMPGRLPIFPDAREDTEKIRKPDLPDTPSPGRMITILPGTPEPGWVEPVMPGRLQLFPDVREDTEVRMKELTLTFFNVSSGPVEVNVTTPSGVKRLGEVPANGSIDHTVSISSKLLPAKVVWSTRWQEAIYHTPLGLGGVHGTGHVMGTSYEFTVSDDTPDQQATILSPGVAQMSPARPESLALRQWLPCDVRMPDKNADAEIRLMGEPADDPIMRSREPAEPAEPEKRPRPGPTREFPPYRYQWCARLG